MNLRVYGWPASISLKLWLPLAKSKFSLEFINRTYVVQNKTDLKTKKSLQGYQG